VEGHEPRESQEVKALNAIATQIAALRNEHKKPKGIGLMTDPASMFQTLTGIDPAEARERGRDSREREQTQLYRLVVLFAAISAIASTASVVVAVVNA
jgi:hypothetical protein